MNKDNIRKLKFVIVAFLIISIPLSYILYTATLVYEANEAYNSYIFSFEPDDNELIIQKIDKALGYAFWDKQLIRNKIHLLKTEERFQEAVNLSVNTNMHIQTALLFELLNKSDSAKLFYQKEIDQQTDYLNDENEEIFIRLNRERTIALMYTFLGEQIKAQKYLSNIPETLSAPLRRSLLTNDFYIESYKNGGYLDYIAGETDIYVFDNQENEIDVDSLFEANRFYSVAESYSKGICTYEIKKIFEDKALENGFRKY